MLSSSKSVPLGTNDSLRKVVNRLLDNNDWGFNRPAKPDGNL